MSANTPGTRVRETAYVTVGAEAANVIQLLIQLQDVKGNNIARNRDVIVTVYEATMIEAVAAAFTLADGGVGALISTTAQARVLATTDATGLLDLDLTDVAGASGKTVYVTVEVLDDLTANTAGGMVYAAATFD